MWLVTLRMNVVWTGQGLAAMATVPQVILPRVISASGLPEKAADGPPPTMASRCNSVAEGLRYILGHPLLPGLYALDWGMTAVSYYRELFPLFVAELFVSGRFGKLACCKSRSITNGKTGLACPSCSGETDRCGK